MQHMPAAGRSSAPERADGEEDMKRVVEENAVVVVGQEGCCMVHVMRALLRSHGVVAKICVAREGAADEASSVIVGGGGVPCKFPAVFIGGRLVGGLDRLMAVHISGELKPMLKQAGALWL